MMLFSSVRFCSNSKIFRRPLFFKISSWSEAFSRASLVTSLFSTRMISFEETLAPGRRMICSIVVLTGEVIIFSYLAETTQEVLIVSSMAPNSATEYLILDLSMEGVRILLKIQMAITKARIIIEIFIIFFVCLFLTVSDDNSLSIVVIVDPPYLHIHKSCAKK